MVDAAADPAGEGPVVDRARYEARQGELLRALHHGGPAPAGFDPQAVERASASVRAKRARALRRAWPALGVALGAEFEARFAEHATLVPLPEHGGGLADGLLLLDRLRPRPRDDAVRAERLLARSIIRLQGDRARPRRAMFLGAVLLRHPPGVIVAVGLAGRRWALHLPLPGGG